MDGECKCKPVKRIFENALPLPYKQFYNKDYNSVRRLKLLLISDILNKFDDFKNLNFQEKMDIISNIENSCLQETNRKAVSYDIECDWDNNQYANIYHSICYTTISNIDDIYVIKNILSGDYHDLASKTYKELNPKKYEELSVKIEKRINTERAVKYTEMFYCRKCKHNQTTVEKVQLRSNDEASSLRITCLYCNNQWVK